MNINDFNAPEFTPNWLEHIFEKQNGLIVKYAEIEGMEGWPFSVHTREGQKWIKDFLWRVTEEVGESYEAHYLLTSSAELTEEDVNLHLTHRTEELSDALHFLVELLILVGCDWEWARNQLDRSKDELMYDQGDVSKAYWQTIYYLTMVGNTLKNKPWKQTEMLTDEKKFFDNLGKAFKALFIAFESVEAYERDVFDFYCRKNQVNQFRQKSNY